jgi:hypothetical protein
VALIRTDVSEDRIASNFRVHECEQVTEQSCKLLYRNILSLRVRFSCHFTLCSVALRMQQVPAKCCGILVLQSEKERF